MDGPLTISGCSPVTLKPKSSRTRFPSISGTYGAWGRPCCTRSASEPRWATVAVIVVASLHYTTGHVTDGITLQSEEELAMSDVGGGGPQLGSGGGSAYGGGGGNGGTGGGNCPGCPSNYVGFGIGVTQIAAGATILGLGLV